MKVKHTDKLHSNTYKLSVPYRLYLRPADIPTMITGTPTKKVTNENLIIITFCSYSLIMTKLFLRIRVLILMSMHTL